MATRKVAMLGCMSFSAAERRRLADLLLQLGPDEPTLCEGWNTRDMAVHLLVRETRPLAAAGMFVAPLQGRLESATREVTGRDYEEVVREWAAGPPRRSPVRLVDPVMNLSEHFIHHEDVRRGGGVVEPRDFSRAVEKQLHRVLSVMAPRALSSSTVPVVLQAEGLARVVAADKRGVSPDGEAVARVSGRVGELLLWVSGRDAAQVELSGATHGIKMSGM